MTPTLPTSTDPDEAEPLGVVCVTSGVSPLGTYTCEIAYTDDVSRVLAPHEVGPYTDTLLAAVVAAEYAAAIVRQHTVALGVSRADAHQLVIDLRKSIPSIDQTSVKPLIVRPSVGRRTGKPFLHLRLAGTTMQWQWEPASVREHAQAVREAVLVADLDAAYRRLLIGSYGIDDTRARAAIGDLIRWR